MFHDKRQLPLQDHQLYFHRSGPRLLRGSGMNFYDFLSCIDAPVQTIVMIDSLGNWGDKNYTSKVRYITGGQTIWELAGKKRTCDADFAWADAKSEASLEDLLPQQVNCLRDMAYGMPEEFMLFPPIDNRYLYYTHDYGWFFHILFREEEEIDRLLVRMARRKWEIFYPRIKEWSLDEEKLRRAAWDGVWMDFSEKRSKDKPDLRLYVTNGSVDIDHMLNHPEKYKNNPL